MKVFLSHSSRDKKFVVRLYEALSLEGVETFLDDRDIRVGDDIRLSIERGISEATHLAYIISSHSLKSRWVQEELSIAKFRAMGEEKLRILPILIEDLTLPPGISHLKYANFLEWNHSERFFQAFNELLQALGIKKISVQAGGLSFSIANLRLLLVAEGTVRGLSAWIEGFLDGFYEGSRAVRFIDRLQSVVCNEIERQDLERQLSDLANVLLPMEGDLMESIKNDIELISCRIRKMKWAPKGDVFSPEENDGAASRIAWDLKHDLRRLAGSLKELIREAAMLRSKEAVPVHSSSLGEPQ
ncbi:MAG TPA: toll/interleukin-1 receptor domain-containing protein [Thermoanaerobaculia bacterium]|nr:toll/interleukin-1 receptor domain-containing protein [Thermoanaerobaculia bacterium]